MARVRITLNHGDIAAFLNSAAVTGILEEKAAGYVAQANAMVAGSGHHRISDADPFASDTVHNASRVVVFVRTNSVDGAVAEASDRTLSKVCPA